ncbi:hypothetical protein O7543_04395 [Solwaraspora sp. WMMA2080]|uniref:hypothetical protein n=1 Tax=unclassified Solwaraspora TaxID=2627926 RepID=UPI00248C1A67|nr:MULTISPECIES: hypothetical protein [unclassified Solwaraspora]WBB99728.1 hypothetical protein O7553_12975 [Solwaraspora sp. WMMA2059]WBC21722.1 hypothetical protein O7543_04395 [Solwaraspora sp. WMMA2080]
MSGRWRSATTPPGDLLRVSGGQHVKIRCRCTGGDRWYGGSDFATAASVRVRRRDWLNLIL